MSASPVVDQEQLKRTWLVRLQSLIEDVRLWAEALDWSTRVIEKTIDDAELGPHKVPALLLQKEAVRILLEPIARTAPGADAVVDLYLLPAYDDIASLYHQDNGWQLFHMARGENTAGNEREAKPLPLSQSTFRQVVEEMLAHAD